MVLRNLFGAISLGERYLAAAALYAGLGLLVLSALPDAAHLEASDSCGPYSSCAEGYACCHGNCIPSDDVCCDDGSSGPSDSCVCCTGCNETQCTNGSTAVCEQ